MPQNTPINGELTFMGSIAGQCSVQAQPIGGALELFLPNQIPTQNQVLAVTALDGFKVTLGWAAPGGGTGVATTFRSVTPLSAAQLIALNTTPVQVIPAPGPNLYINLLSAMAVFTPGTTPYTLTGDPFFVVGPSNAPYVSAFSVGKESGFFTGFFTQTVNPVIMEFGDNYSSTFNFANKAMVIATDLASTAVSGGNGTVLVSCIYTIEATS